QNFSSENPSTYAFIGRRMYLDSAEIAEIQDFAYRGNTVFISSERFNSTLLEHIFLGTAISDSSEHHLLNEDWEEAEYEDEELELEDESDLIIEDDSLDQWREDYDEEYDDEEYIYEDDEEDYYYYEDDVNYEDLFTNLYGSPYLDSKQDSMLGVYYALNESANKRVNIKFKREHEPAMTQFNFWNEELRNNSLVEFEVIGKSTEGSCFIRVEYGEGEYLLHTVPLALTNYLLLEEEVFKYNQELFSHLDAQSVIWDESSRNIKLLEKDKSSGSDASASLRDVEEGPLSFILNSVGLKHSWFLMLGLTLLFFVFGSKRKQRIVPVLHPPKNTSIEFAETLGHMFRQQNSHNRMIRIKNDLFNDFVSQRYGIRMNFRTDEEKTLQIKQLSTKSGIPKEDLNKLVDQLTSTQDSSETKKRATELIITHQLLDEFYRNCK
ncbi:MAG: hypothetical protein ACPGED_02490, partial [Flavobacteriales bacterium]